jgi:nitrate/nitrite-specific signal transduction histidine kinase
MVKITIRDDGQGFETDEQEKASGDHFGLSIMKARATRIGGKLTIRSQPGNGTVVTLVWVSNYARDALKSEGEQSSFEYGSTILSLNSDLSK